MTSRRNFLREAVLGAAGLGCAARPALAAPGARVPALEAGIGLQLFTVAKQLQADWQGTLRAVAAMGYRYVEGGGGLGGSRPALLALLKEIGLVPLVGGASMGQLRSSLDQQIEATLALGQEYLVCYWPWEDEGKDKRLDDWKRAAEALNAIGRKVAGAGLRFCHHNHAIEFAITEGRVPYDVLLESTDPRVVGMQIDLYWIEKGGQKPLPYFEQHPGRFPLWHVKDMDATAARSFACVGQGVIDWRALFAEAQRAGLEHVFVEHDEPADGLACARASIEYLKALRL